jgi:hypothetical protein
MPLEIHAAIRAVAVELSLRLLHDAGSRRARPLTVCVDARRQLHVQRLRVAAVHRARGLDPIRPLAAHHDPPLALEAHLRVHEAIIAVGALDQHRGLKAERPLEPG